MKKQDRTWKLRLVLSFIALISSLVIFALCCHSCTKVKDAEAEEPALGFEDAMMASAAESVFLQEDDAFGFPFELFELLDGCSGYQVGKLPVGFSEEAVEPSDMGCVEVYSTQGVVGMLRQGSVSEAIDLASSALEANGWALVDGGKGSSGRTFVKSHGKYRWIFLSGSQIAESASLWFAYTDGR